MSTSTITPGKSHQEALKPLIEPTVEQLATGLIISVGEARKILGADSKDYTDDQLAVYIFEMTQLAPDLLKISSILINKHL